jgi:hypothetical protein
MERRVPCRTASPASKSFGERRPVAIPDAPDTPSPPGIAKVARGPLPQSPLALPVQREADQARVGGRGEGREVDQAHEQTECEKPEEQGSVPVLAGCEPGSEAPGHGGRQRAAQAAPGEARVTGARGDLRWGGGRRVTREGRVPTAPVASARKPGKRGAGYARRRPW